MDFLAGDIIVGYDHSIDEARHALRPVTEGLFSLIPPGMRVDAKTTDDDNLQDCLEAN